MIEKFYAIDFNCHHIAYAIKINDILIETSRFHDMPRRTIKANQWIYNGKNTFEINLSINPRWENALDDNNFRFNIIEYSGINGEYSPQPVVQNEWYYSEGTQFPVNLKEEFTTDIPYGNWIWQDADTIDEENFDRHSLNEYLKTLHACLKEKDFSRLEPLLKTKATELAEAYYLDINERFRDQQSFFTEELFGNPAWDMQPIDFDTLFYRFHAENRLVEVINKEGKSPIRSTSLDGYTFSIPLFLCHKNNQWILCR